METENYRRELSLQDRIAREEFAGIVYEQYAKTLDTYAVTNGNNPLVLARIHTNMGMKPTTEHRAFLLLMRKRLAAMDADFMMSEYTIDTRSLVKFLDLVLAEKK
ncbi:MAG: hypothetical protein H6765_02950 [Candidatus Peribacteria bacterium]|nr:MAG: hypothetical protein H6765_02950 [Candidatus Peribacteria bacterium]